MNKKITAFLMVAFMSVAATSYAAEDSADSSESDKFMCKKIRDAKLKELKRDLVEDCNLSKPFSISETDIGVNSAYTFCCHKK